MYRTEILITRCPLRCCMISPRHLRSLLRAARLYSEVFTGQIDVPPPIAGLLAAGIDIRPDRRGVRDSIL